jgi:urease gamma subunit
MKHIEALISQNNQLVTANMTMANGIVAMCFGPQGVIQQSIRAQLEAVAVVKDAMLDMSRERKQLIIEESKAAKELQSREAVIKAIPQLVNRFTGREVFDEKNNRAQVLETLALKITPSDMEMLVAMGKLTKEEALILSAQFAAIVDEKRKEIEALKTVPTEEAPSTTTSITKGNGGLS